MAEHMCPWWVGYLLASPIRKLFHRPEQLLGTHLRPGMTVADVGCAMGYFSIPMARLVGDTGRVICIDLQPRMLRSLEKRAAKAGVSQRIEPHRCSRESLELGGLDQSIDFVLAFAVAHEVPNPEGLFAELHTALIPGGRLLLAEPRGHVTLAAFDETLKAAEAAGFSPVDRLEVRRSHAVLLEKSAAPTG